MRAHKTTFLQRLMLQTLMLPVIDLPIWVQFGYNFHTFGFSVLLYLILKFVTIACDIHERDTDSFYRCHIEVEIKKLHCRTGA